MNYIGLLKYTRKGLSCRISCCQVAQPFSLRSRGIVRLDTVQRRMEFFRG